MTRPITDVIDLSPRVGRNAGSGEQGLRGAHTPGSAWPVSGLAWDFFARCRGKSSTTLS